MNFFFRQFSYVLFSILAFGFAWLIYHPGLSQSEYLKIRKETPPLIISSIGKDRNQGNLLGIQAYIQAVDYSNAERFYQFIESYLESAKEKGLLKTGTLVMFPEHIGTPLFLLDERKEVILSDRFDVVIKRMMISNLHLFIPSYFQFSTDVYKSLMSIKQRKMKKVYRDTFRSLSKYYDVPIVAGSILEMEKGKLVKDSYSFYNKSYAFFPDGKIIILSKKMNLDKLESQLMIRGDKKEQSFFTISGKRYQVLLSLDSLVAANYMETASDKTDVFLSPSALLSFSVIPEESFTVNEESQNLEKVKLPEILGKSDQDRKWLYKSLFSNLNNRKNSIGMQVFLKGKFLNTELQGIGNIITERGKIDVLLSDNQPGLLNVWF
ncbi:MAG: hypothetical protein H7A25_02310 [Leptospiraceae bacterium]|nr:hypothetical protein [Leptospiraceae bacterium]MCP5498710.1 hypothetical protein [Leptospiraceae bacterium]